VTGLGQRFQLLLVMLSPPLSPVVAVVATTLLTGTPETAVEFTKGELETAGHEGAQIGETQEHQWDSCTCQYYK
jgi:hypothetical protein